MRRLSALFFLGWMFFLHFFRRLGWLLRGKPDQLLKFYANYAGDRIQPITAEERVVQLGLQRCTQCGLCAIANPAFAKLTGEFYRSPALIPISLSRSQPEFSYAAELVRQLAGQKIDNRICPQGVPLQEAVELMTRRMGN